MNNSIHNTLDKIKQKIKNSLESNTTKDILMSLIVILVGLGSFGLGRLSKDNRNSGIKIEYPNQNENTSSNLDLDKTASNTTLDSKNRVSTLKNTPKNSPEINDTVSVTENDSQSSIGKAFFASKIGKKYYSIGCSGGKTIKQENRIYFDTESEAQTAGYEKSSSCK